MQLNTRIDEQLKAAIDAYCKSKGIAVSHFVQEALLDRLEEFEDIGDLKRIRHEPTKPFVEVLADLRLDGDV